MSWTYATFAKAGSKAIAAGESGERKATVVRERTGSEVRPAESLLLMLVTLVRGSAWARVALLRAPVLRKKNGQ